MTSSTTAVRTAAAAAAAARLQAAEATRTPCAPVRDLIGSDDVDLAYAVQRRLAAARSAAGARVVGHKIGLTSPAVQAQLGVNRPDFGLLFDDMDVSGAPVDISRLMQPKIEAEIAFVLGADIIDPDATAASVRDAVAVAVPALEIVDSRIAGWDITFADTVADNASSGLFVLGSNRVPLEAFRPVDAEMMMTLDGEQVSVGTGEACLGDPLNALAGWHGLLFETGTRFAPGRSCSPGPLGRWWLCRLLASSLPTSVAWGASKRNSPSEGHWDE